jgi:hypothetical protein
VAPLASYSSPSHPLYTASAVLTLSNTAIAKNHLSLPSSYFLNTSGSNSPGVSSSPSSPSSLLPPSATGTGFMPSRRGPFASSSAIACSPICDG